MDTPLKKYALIAMLLTILISPVKAQFFTGGIAGGVSTGTFVINDSERFRTELEGKNFYGFEAGLYAKLNFGPFYFKPMIMYGFQKGELQAIQSGITSDFNIHSINIPVFLGYHIFGPLSIEAAPVFNYRVFSTKHFDGALIELGNSAIGYRAGASLDLGIVLFSASFEGARYTNDKNDVVLKQPGKIIFGAGIRLGNPNSKRNARSYYYNSKNVR